MAYVASVAPVNTIVVRTNPMYSAWRCGGSYVDGPLDRNDFSLHLQPYMTRETFENIVDDINRIYNENVGNLGKKLSLIILAMFVIMAICMGVSVGSFTHNGVELFWLPFVGFLFFFFAIIGSVIYSRNVYARALRSLEALLQTINARLAPNVHMRVVMIDHHHHHYHHHHHRHISWILEIEVGGGAVAVPMPNPYPAAYPPPPSFPTAQPTYPYPAQPGYPPQSQPGYPPQSQPGYPPQAPYPYPDQYPQQPQPQPQQQQQQQPIPMYSENIDEGPLLPPTPGKV